MTKLLTAAAQANLDAGAMSGPGTDVCAGCMGEKEPSRLNSARCARCGRGGLGATRSTSPTRVIRATLPADVAERFVAEAQARGKSANAYLADLIITRDERRVSRNSQQDGATPVAPSSTDRKDTP